MRGEEEAILHPHSQVRHEQLHNQYNKMKEEEDHWQDVSISVFFSLFVSTPSEVCGQHSCLVFNSYICLCVLGPGQVEEQEEKYLSGPYQKRRGEEDDGAADVRRCLYLWKEKKR